MKLSYTKIKLKDVQVTPFPDTTISSMDDIMYLYYTLEVKQGKRKIQFIAGDSPVIHELRGVLDYLDSMPPYQYKEELEYKVCEASSSFGLDHSIRVEKLNDNYNLHIYEEFGKSVCIQYLSRIELDKFLDYIDKKLNKVIEVYR